MQKVVKGNSNLKIKKPKSLLKKIVTFLISSIAVLIGFVLLIFLTEGKALRVIPVSFNPETVVGKTELYASDSNGVKTLIGSFYIDNREPVGVYEIPQIIQDATVAAEDVRFYEHGGIDFQAIMRAATSNFTNDTNQGGSTITQQYVKNLRVYSATRMTKESDRDAAYADAIKNGMDRKLKEALFAVNIESRMSKKEILNGYLNIIGFGGNMYGIKVAAKYYFGKELKDITAAEAATLISIVNNPNSLRIDVPESESNGAANGYAKTKKRRDYILKTMLDKKFITQQVHDNSVAQAITPVITPYESGCFYAEAAFFCDYVRNVMLQDVKYGETEAERVFNLYNNGLKVETTLDMSIQDISLKSMKARVPFKSDALKIGASSVSVENSTGRIIAMVQNKEFSNNAELAAKDDSYTAVNYNTSYNFGGSSGFQPGSTFKLFTLIEWLKAGHKLYENVNGLNNYKKLTNSCDRKGYWEGDYNLRNDLEGFDGNITVWRATTNSINTGYLAMAEQLDLCKIMKSAEDLGVVRADGKPMFVDAPAVIGTNEVSPLDITGAYAAVGNYGKFCKPTAIDRVTSFSGEVLVSDTVSCKDVIDSEVDKAVLKVLRVTARYGTAGRGYPNDDSDLFAKTGTTDNANDAWVIGGNSKVTTGVWVGNTIGKKTLWRLSYNGSGAADFRFKLFSDIMKDTNLIYTPEAFKEPQEKFLY